MTEGSRCHGDVTAGPQGAAAPVAADAQGVSDLVGLAGRERDTSVLFFLFLSDMWRPRALLAKTTRNTTGGPLLRRF
uniref:Uncharacterized protein n=1 Tax=Leersia perrieri TaxID=77586 RepID=A0A0D9VNA7_9ORYZ